MTDHPTLLSRAMVEAALKDEKFFKKMPEFITLRPSLQTMKAATNHGCSGCRGRAVTNNITAAFLAVLSTLNDSAVQRLKRYLGIKKLMYSAHNPRTGAYDTKVI